MAIDRRAIVDIAGYGYPIVNEYASGLGRTYQDWTNAEAERKFGRFTKFDQRRGTRAAGRERLSRRQWRRLRRKSRRQPDQLLHSAPNGWTDWVNSCQLVAEGLNAIGINARVSTPEPAAWTQKLISGNYDMAINAYLTGETPHRSLDMAFHSRHVGKSRFAATRFTDPELDSALNNFIATIDPVAQRQAMDKVQMILAANTPYVPLFSNPIWYEYNTRRFKGWFNADNPVARPDVFDGTPERLLHLLALEPVSNS